MRIKCVFGHTKRVVLACCECVITFVPEITWRVTNVNFFCHLQLQPWSKRVGTLKKMRRENTPCLLKVYLTCYKCLEMLLKEPVSAVPPSPQQVTFKRLFPIRGVFQTTLVKTLGTLTQQLVKMTHFLSPRPPLFSVDVMASNLFQNVDKSCGFVSIVSSKKKLTGITK